MGGAGGSLGVAARCSLGSQRLHHRGRRHRCLRLNGAVYTLPYDLMADFEPIACWPRARCWCWPKHMPAKDLKELVAWLKDNHGKVSQGHIGSGTLSHLCGLYMQSTARFVDIRPLSWRCRRAAGLTGGQIDLIRAAPGGGAPPWARGGQIWAMP
jgi:tripartite-type tricarboxylate transporter receptor subunit TctC